MLEKIPTLLIGDWQVCDCFSEKITDFWVMEWDSTINIYNPCTGGTYLLNLFPYEIFQFLLLNPANLSAIAKYMAVLCDEENNEKWENKILALLKQLKELELIDYQS